MKDEGGRTNDELTITYHGSRITIHLRRGPLGPSAFLFPLSSFLFHLSSVVTPPTATLARLPATFLPTETFAGQRPSTRSSA
jgi:hypothetical protein